MIIVVITDHRRLFKGDKENWHRREKRLIDRYGYSVSIRMAYFPTNKDIRDSAAIS